jgi:hypothetical protein
MPRCPGHSHTALSAGLVKVQVALPFQQLQREGTGEQKMRRYVAGGCLQSGRGGRKGGNKMTFEMGFEGWVGECTSR